jgi:3-dehydroshikimate dehydratase
MIRPGLVSITFRQLSPVEVIDLVVQGGLEGIEWGGDVHVPHGQPETARRVARRTREAGLAVAAYGSYYRVGVSEAQGLAFETVLETATALGAPTVRVWAGDRGSATADAAYWSAVVSDSRRVADLAAAAGVGIAFEYHRNTLTDTRAAAARLLEEACHPQITSYWQPPSGAMPQVCLQGLQGVLSRLSNVHVFHWLAREQGIDRRPLAEGAGPWARYLQEIAGSGREHWALIEFVRGDTPEQFLADAQTLRTWLG